MKIYLAGCGKIGAKLGTALQADKHAVVGLKRQAADFGFPVLSVDLGENAAVEQLPSDAEAIIFTVTPSSHDDTGYAHVYDTILGNVIDWAARHATPPLVLLVSSTGVYGQKNGEWVDENSPTEPTAFNGRWIVAGEQQLRQRLQNTLTVRFSGIYNENRMWLVKKALSGKPIQQNPAVWTNRIHEDDCVGVLQYLIQQYQLGRAMDAIYLASDDTPISQYDICAHLCKALGKPRPPIQTDGLSDALNKRCNNARIKALGYVFRYPDYVSGYRAILDAFIKP